jgi:hypothetical protein
MVLSLLAGCATTKLKDYNSNSTEEKEIIQVMTRAQGVWNKSDESGFIDEFCPKGEYAYVVYSSNRGEKLKISKDDIPEHFSLAQSAMLNYDLENPELSITGDKANFTAKNTAHPINWKSKVLLLRKNEKWCIEDWDFNFHY